MNIDMTVCVCVRIQPNPVNYETYHMKLALAILRFATYDSKTVLIYAHIQYCVIAEYRWR